MFDFSFSKWLRPRSRLLAVSVAFVVVLAGSFPGGASLEEDIEELEREQERVQTEKAEKAADVDAATATAEELSAALEVLNAAVNQQVAAVESAQQSLESARAAQDVAVVAVAAQNQTISDLEQRLSARAISSFVTQERPRSLILEEANPNTVVRMQSLVDAITEDGVSVTDELRAAKEDLQIEEALAVDAAARAKAIEAQLRLDLEVLEVSRGAQADLVAEAEERLERSLAEAWVLSETDKELSVKLEKKNSQLAAQVALAQRRANAAPTSGANPSFPSAADIVNVGGIWVHTSISANLQSLLNDAAAQGHNFSGGGYRDSQSQIRLRRAHCGTSDYAVYRMPASQCSPPTARPGSSQHEQGKAIDFRYNGSTISSRSNAGYRWLAANAANYGLFNLPSEPWHWSINGR